MIGYNLKNISGGFLVDKPVGITARGVDNKIGRLLKTRRVGHIGTLDPNASGLLPVLVGKATRIAPYVDAGIKGYRAEITLGKTTDTDDIEGNVIDESPVQVAPSRIYEELLKFVGEIEQVPPKYSAKKVDGVPMYRRARRSEDVIIQPKRVVIYSIDNVEIDIPKIRFDIVCGTGTYLRAIARDIGYRLGCGGFLSALKRVSVGKHKVENAVPLDEILRSIRDGEPQKYLLSEIEMLPHLQKVKVDEIGAWQVLHGQIVKNLDIHLKPETLFAILSEDGRLLAIAEKIPGRYKYRRVLT